MKARLQVKRRHYNDAARQVTLFKVGRRFSEIWFALFLLTFVRAMLVLLSTDELMVHLMTS